MKPFFQCAENAVAYWEFSRQWSANVVTDLIPVFIRVRTTFFSILFSWYEPVLISRSFFDQGLQCTSYKIQKATWEALSRMLTSKDMNLRSIVLEVRREGFFCVQETFFNMNLFLSSTEILLKSSGCTATSGIFDVLPPLCRSLML